MTNESSIKAPEAGTITALERQQKNRNRISVFIDDVFAFGVHQDILLQHMLYVGLQLEQPAIQEIQQADQLIRAKMSAISYLSYRARTEHEIREKLKRDGFDEPVRNTVIDRLHELSYINDQSFVLNYVRDRLNRKGHGPIRLKADLRKLGISKEQVDEALNEVSDANNILDRALEQARKRIKRLQKETDPYKKRRKLQNFLLRKGHTLDTAREVVERLEQEHPH